uniref:Uncharacterized protein n=1 Tax=Chromera velia CCMP2878 TaxID=1169474 RepID=A0A0G4I619_9ALVE|eukprot:Cvel_11277.t1-p1 / transcript=Cvel_11277.t1 / gene=Cvel_11277 / organism=Chromera_velia_CCMP2878 / gene_product=Receptor-interacting serine/threonine-protein, putative / transcript_product=Receptor-interacting serine/threonine-protein, putative / location=Cvel_scaffold703:51918-59966(-) / protein_length=1129 / sequence_SO=supercontig / SO=protein_coding / is_pseudo=false
MEEAGAASRRLCSQTRAAIRDLFNAVRDGEFERTLSLLQEVNADPLEEDAPEVQELRRCLCEAVSGRHQEIAKLLLIRVGGDQVAFHHAVDRGQTELIPFMVAAKNIDFNLLVDGEAALHSAARNDDVPTLSVLLDVGVDPLVLTEGEKDSVLQVAVLEESVNVVRELLERMGRTSERPIWVSKREREIAEKIEKLDVNSKNTEGQTALHHATMKGFAVLIEMLIVEGGADVDAQDSNGNTPLHICSWEWGGQTEPARLLLNAEANVHAKNTQGDTALILAAWKGQDSLVEVLLQQGANADDISGEGKSALCYATEKATERGRGKGFKRCMEILLEGGASPHLKGSLNKSALDAVEERKKLLKGDRTVESLLKNPKWKERAKLESSSLRDVKRKQKREEAVHERGKQQSEVQREVRRKQREEVEEQESRKQEWSQEMERQESRKQKGGGEMERQESRELKEEAQTQVVDIPSSEESEQEREKEKRTETGSAEAPRGGPKDLEWSDEDRPLGLLIERRRQAAQSQATRPKEKKKTNMEVASGGKRVNGTNGKQVGGQRKGLEVLGSSERKGTASKKKKTASRAETGEGVPEGHARPPGSRGFVSWGLPVDERPVAGKDATGLYGDMGAAGGEERERERGDGGVAAAASGLDSFADLLEEVEDIFGVPEEEEEERQGGDGVGRQEVDGEEDEYEGAEWATVSAELFKGSNGGGGPFQFPSAQQPANVNPFSVSVPVPFLPPDPPISPVQPPHSLSAHLTAHPSASSARVQPQPVREFIRQSVQRSNWEVEQPFQKALADPSASSHWAPADPSASSHWAPADGAASSHLDPAGVATSPYRAPADSAASSHLDTAGVVASLDRAPPADLEGLSHTELPWGSTWSTGAFPVSASASASSCSSASASSSALPDSVFPLFSSAAPPPSLAPLSNPPFPFPMTAAAEAGTLPTPPSQPLVTAAAEVENHEQPLEQPPACPPQSPPQGELNEVEASDRHFQEGGTEAREEGTEEQMYRDEDFADDLAEDGTYYAPNPEHRKAATTFPVGVEQFQKGKGKGNGGATDSAGEGAAPAGPGGRTNLKPKEAAADANAEKAGGKLPPPEKVITPREEGYRPLYIHLQHKGLVVGPGVAQEEP